MLLKWLCSITCAANDIDYLHCLWLQLATAYLIEVICVLLSINKLSVQNELTFRVVLLSKSTVWVQWNFHQQFCVSNFGRFQKMHKLMSLKNNENVWLSVRDILRLVRIDYRSTFLMDDSSVGLPLLCKSNAAVINSSNSVNGMALRQIKLL